MLFSTLKKIPLKGKLVIIDAKGKSHSFGNEEPLVQIKLASKSIERKIFFNPSLHIGEAYMNNELIIQKGTVEEFINIITKSYDAFVSNNTFFKLLEFTFTKIRKYQHNKTHR